MLKKRKRKTKKQPKIQVFEKLISKLQTGTKIKSKYTKSIKFLIFVICKGFHRLLNKFNTKLFTKRNILNLIKDINIYAYFSNPLQNFEGDERVRFEKIPYSYLPETIKNDKDVAMLFARTFPHIYLYEEFHELWGSDDDIINIVIKIMGCYLIEKVPEELITEELILRAIPSCKKIGDDYGCLFASLTPQLKNNKNFIFQICKITGNSEVLEYLEPTDRELYLNLVDSGVPIHYTAWEHIAEFPDIMIKSVILDGSLNQLPRELLTKEICEKAIKNAPEEAIENCHEDLIDVKLIKLALKLSNGKARIPHKYIEEYPELLVLGFSLCVETIHNYLCNTYIWFPKKLIEIQNKLKEYKKIVSSFDYFMFGAGKKEIIADVLIKLISQYYDYNNFLESLIIWERAEENLRTFLEWM
jgi:hypothetical protein